MKAKLIILNSILLLNLLHFTELTAQELVCANGIVDYPRQIDISDCSKTSQTFIDFYKNKEYFIPNENIPIKTLHVNINIWQRSDGTGNLQNIAEHRNRLQQIIEWANGEYETNSPDAYPPLPYTVEPALYDTKIRIVLDDIFFYQDPSDDSSYYYGGHDYQTYGHNVLLDSYIIDNYPERTKALNIHLTGSVWPGVGGYSEYGSIESFYRRDPDMADNDVHDWWFSRHWAHEIGHSFDLWHTYDYKDWEQNCYLSGYDFLTDIYDVTSACPDYCDVCLIDETNNNLMGGGNEGHISSLQMGIIHRSTMLRNFHNVNYNLRDHVTGYSSSPYNITQNEIWDFSIKFYQDVVLKSGKTLTIKCDMQLVPDAKVKIESNATLLFEEGTISNEYYYDMPWQGVELLGYNSQMILNPSTSLEIPEGAYVEIQHNSDLIIKNNAYLTFKSGSTLNLSGNGQVKVEEGGVLKLEEGVQIIGTGNEKLVIYGNLVIENDDVQFKNCKIEIRNNGHLTIGNNTIFSLNHDSPIFMYNSSKFEVENGSVLILKEGVQIIGTGNEIISVSGDMYINASNILLNGCLTEVKNDGNLTIQTGASISLLDGAVIDVEPNGNLFIENNASIFGSHSSMININGNVQIGTDVTFDKTAGSGSFGELHLNNNSSSVTFNGVTFNHGQLINNAFAMTIVDSYISNTYLGSHRGFVSIDNTTFNGVWTHFTNTVNSLPFFNLLITNCTFKNESHAGLTIDEYDYFNIKNNQIFNCGDGIALYNSGNGRSGNQIITNNTIYNNSSSGISIYNSTVSVTENYVHDNLFGVKFFNNSNVAFYGSSNASSYGDMNLVEDNDSYEVFSSGYSFPWYFRYNAIIDLDNTGGQSDPLVYYVYAPGDQIPKDIRYNCWGNNFGAGDDLYPDVFLYNPTWCPGGGGISIESAEELYTTGLNQFSDEDYTQAESSLKLLIDLYPDTHYAAAAMKDLFSLEQFMGNDYNGLMQYYNTNDHIQSDTTLQKTAEFLVNKCKVASENWQPAIDYYEERIENPETMEDSIFAIIDLGHTYLLMENSGDRSMAQGKLLAHKPESRESFSKKRNYLLSLLPLNMPSEEYIILKRNQKVAELIQNVPNPFNNYTMKLSKVEC
jgi:parallel beta-helix repeat protein